LKQLELSATLRTMTGNGPARRLRGQGMIPAVLYGPATPPVMLAVIARDFEHVVQKGNIRRTIFSLNLEGGSSAAKPAVVKELQRNPVSGKFLHVDFYEIDLQRKLRVLVPVTIRGKAKGEEDGGMLQTIKREIAVLCLPSEMPEALEVDVTDLGIGGTLHVNDIALPSGVELPPGGNYTVLTVVSPKAEPVAVEAAAEVVEGAEAEKPVEAGAAAE